MSKCRKIGIESLVKKETQKTMYVIDRKIQLIVEKEEDRQTSTIELIASENFASDAVMDLCGSVFTNKYAEGYPKKRYYNGCEHMDEIEDLAIEKVKSLFGCKYANVQPHSGANANTAVFQAFLKPGDTILGMDLASGGHLSHGSPPNISGKIYDAHSYGVDDEGLLDYDAIEKQAIKIKPKMIISGASAYPRQIDFSRFYEIAQKTGSYLMADIAHYAGLIAGSQYESPFPYADVVTSTTHKTLRGPRGGIILWNKKDYTRRINSAVFPGTQGGPLMHIIAAKAQCFHEALQPEFETYASNVVENAQAMGKVFRKRGIKIQTDGTDSHILLLNLIKSEYSGREAADLLEENGITVNKNGIPNDPRPFTETSGIRIGTAAETTRHGGDTKWFENLANKISDILS
jgi:glycine hydroxymethyltransferase